MNSKIELIINEIRIDTKEIEVEVDSACGPSHSCGGGRWNA